jgi:hypothetical protein
MTRRLLFVLCLTSLSSIAGFAQAPRTITNFDLDKYRQQRVAAEQELREDYAKLGFASPEEMSRRNAESEQQLLDLSQRLKAERLESERMQLERDEMQQTMLQQQSPSGYNDAVQPGDLFLPTTLGFGRGRVGRGRIRQQQGYFAGGQFWPQGSRTPKRPLIAPAHPAPHH